MPSLPLSVRAALWTTALLQGEVNYEDWFNRAHAGSTDVAGDLEWTTEWRDADETLAVAVLPRPGRPGWISAADGPVLVAATEASEAILAVTTGSVAVPSLQEYGPVGDRGVLVTWTAYPGMPVARHRLEATDLRELSLRFATSIREAADDLEAAGGTPWSSSEVLSAGRFGRLGRLPAGIPARALELMARSALVSEAAHAGLTLEAGGPAMDLQTSMRREAVLRGLATTADETLEGAAAVAAMALAGWIPGDRRR